MRSQHLKRREEDQEFKSILGHMYSEFKDAGALKKRRVGKRKRAGRRWRAD